METTSNIKTIMDLGMCQITALNRDPDRQGYVKKHIGQGQGKIKIGQKWKNIGILNMLISKLAIHC